MIRCGTKHENAQDRKKRLTIEAARKNALPIDWSEYQPVKPQMLGTKVV